MSRGMPTSPECRQRPPATARRTARSLWLSGSRVVVVMVGSLRGSVLSPPRRIALPGFDTPPRFPREGRHRVRWTHEVIVVRGAEALVGSLVGAGVDVCFMNPGTSEMHFVQALDSVPEMRGVLTLFEGVATGAADAYARVAGRAAAVLLHLGPGLGNGMANLHNARRAGPPLLCVVGA